MGLSKVCVIGLGYIGLPTAAVAAASGYEVVGLDVNEDIVRTINDGKIHIVEPGLDQVVQASVKAKKLKATCIPEPADVFIITVPTPFKGDDHAPDLTYIKSVVEAISPILSKGNLIILESTSPVGTTEKMIEWFSANRKDLIFPELKKIDSDIFVSYCPERVLPGNILKELSENDRVIGGQSPKSADLAIDFYSKFVTGKFYKTDTRTAEMSKLVENSYRDVNIAFANELAAISDNLDINVWDLIKLANKHPRVNILNPGAGVGGHCIAVDPWFIVNQNPEIAVIIRQARLINDHKPRLIIQEVSDFCNNQKTNFNKEIKIAIFGLSYKPDIDDFRESPSLMIANHLLDEYPDNVYVVEPNISKNHEILSSGLNLISQEIAFSSCDLMVFLTPHSQFKEDIKNRVIDTHVLDYCGITEGI